MRGVVGLLNKFKSQFHAIVCIHSQSYQLFFFVTKFNNIISYVFN